MLHGFGSRSSSSCESLMELTKRQQVNNVDCIVNTLLICLVSFLLIWFCLS